MSFAKNLRSKYGKKNIDKGNAASQGKYGKMLKNKGLNLVK